jgi:hypothetical protein
MSTRIEIVLKGQNDTVKISAPLSAYEYQQNFANASSQGYNSVTITDVDGDMAFVNLDAVQLIWFIQD